MKKFEMITSICAIIVAITALGVAMYEADVIRTHQELSVWPYLNFESTSVAEINGNPLPIAFYLKNNGIGPAQIKKITYTFKEKEYENLREVFDLILPQNKTGAFTSDKSVMKVLLPEKQHLLVGAFTSPKETEIFTREAREHLKIEVCYCSLYKTCWKLHGHNEVTKVKNCK